MESNPFTEIIRARIAALQQEVQTAARLIQSAQEQLSRARDARSAAILRIDELERLLGTLTKEGLGDEQDQTQETQGAPGDTVPPPQENGGD